MRINADLSVPVSFDLEVKPESIGSARDLVRRVLMDHPQVEDAALAISELVTNVVRHAADSPLATLVIESTLSDSIRISVRQTAGSIDQLVPGSGDGGHGLRIVEAVTDRWGVEQQDSWVGVWFEIACGPT
ncbi:MAG TPA: ATP-binding protein [Acidimicrobiia bacterium]|nr:ATP-binding protein [Acidimicrobiia bacterium]